MHQGDYDYKRQPSADMREFRTLVHQSKSIIAVCGAGLSAASGIPTFRGAGGMWRKYDAMSLASPEAFTESPSRVWQFYHYRREVALAAQPNAAHKALAHFWLPEFRKRVAPDASFSLITQNVDGLSVQALHTLLEAESEPAAAVTPPLLEMHGRLFDVVCTSESCGHTEYNTTSPICPALAGLEKAVDALDVDPDIPESELPRCSKCSALARPGVVWYGEAPKHLNQIEDLVEAADLCLVIGTSSTAKYAYQVQLHGGKFAVFNLERSEGDSDADYLFLGPCEKTLPEALSLEL
ncbi:DHS-like NAD/FAD-binding domain-containing protein [Mycena rebaudengoi]|nr:DHS-like NAD/FAD-binding domain-containing protein [Mycena rebaudengoi]